MGSGSVLSKEQLRQLLIEADELCDKSRFDEAVAIYQKVADSGEVNCYDVKQMMLKPLCEAGHFAQAEALAEELLGVLRQGGAPVNSSRAMYWYLLAKHKGDKRRAMDDFVKM